MRVLLTGMSGTGKSAVVAELRRRGYTAYDADEDGFTEPSGDGGWRWRLQTVAELLARSCDDLLFFAGCSDEQTQFHWDRKVLLTAPEPVIIERLRTRSTNSYGKAPAELTRILADRRDIEPLLRLSADVVVDTVQPVARVTDIVLGAVGQWTFDTQR